MAAIPLLLSIAASLFDLALAQTTTSVTSSPTTDSSSVSLSSNTTTSTAASSTSATSWDSGCIYDCFPSFNVSLSVCNNNDWMSSRYQCICERCRFSSIYDSRTYPDDRYGLSAYDAQLQAVRDRVNIEACPSNTFVFPTPTAGCPTWTVQSPYTTLAPNGLIATVVVYGDPPVSTATESPWLYYERTIYYSEPPMDRAPIIAGITIGGVVAIALAVGAFLLKKRRKRALRQRELEKDVESSNGDSTAASVHASSSTTPATESEVSTAPVEVENSAESTTAIREISPVINTEATEPPVYDEVKEVDREIENKTTYAVVESLRNPKEKSTGPSLQPPPYQAD